MNHIQKRGNKNPFLAKDTEFLLLADTRLLISVNHKTLE